MSTSIIVSTILYIYLYNIMIRSVYTILLFPLCIKCRWDTDNINCYKRGTSRAYDERSSAIQPRAQRRTISAEK